MDQTCLVFLAFLGTKKGAQMGSQSTQFTNGCPISSDASNSLTADAKLLNEFFSARLPFCPYSQSCSGCFRVIQCAIAGVFR